MWKFKLFIAISCIAMSTLMYLNFMAGNWFLLSVDTAIVLLWADFLWRYFKGRR